jgi:hypothetical protein
MSLSVLKLPVVNRTMCRRTSRSTTDSLEDRSICFAQKTICNFIISHIWALADIAQPCCGEIPCQQMSTFKTHATQSLSGFLVAHRWKLGESWRSHVWSQNRLFRFARFISVDWLCCFLEHQWEGLWEHPSQKDA